MMETEKFNTDAVTYEKFDCDLGYVMGEHDIMQMKVKRFKEENFNQLIGTFDENGAYIISDEILVELVGLTKKIDAQTVNGTEARAFVGDRVLRFNMTPPQVLENGNAYCYLQLLEEISHINGYYIDTLTTVIATYEYKYDEFFLNNAYRAFNLQEFKENDPDATAPQLVPDYLGQRYAVISAMLLQFGEALDKLEEAYFNKRIQLLSEHPEVAVVLAEFANKRNKLEPYFLNAEHKYYLLNQILDEVLEMDVCKKSIEQSNVKYHLREADMKFYKLNMQAKEKLRESHQVQQAKDNAMFTDLSAKGKAPAPAQKKVAPNVKINSGNKNRGGKSKGGGGAKKAGPAKKPEKKQEQAKPLYEMPSQQKTTQFVKNTKIQKTLKTQTLENSNMQMGR